MIKSSQDNSLISRNRTGTTTTATGHSLPPPLYGGTKKTTIVVNHDSSWIKKSNPKNVEDGDNNNNDNNNNAGNTRFSTTITNPFHYQYDADNYCDETQALKHMSEGFESCLRCKRNDAMQIRTTTKDRTGSIHVGKLLTVIESVMIRSMESHKMVRGLDDLKYHLHRAQILYNAMLSSSSSCDDDNSNNDNDDNGNGSTEHKRDCFQEYMSYSNPTDTGSAATIAPPKGGTDIIHNSSIIVPPVDDIVVAVAVAPSATATGKSTTIRASETLSLASARNLSRSSSFNSLMGLVEMVKGGEGRHSDITKTFRCDNFLDELSSTTRTKLPPSLPSSSVHKGNNVMINDDAINAGKHSMFWLCYYVRYLYDVHRLVLKEGYDPIDASAMSFMRHMYPFSFGKADSIYHLKHHYYKNAQGNQKGNERTDPAAETMHTSFNNNNESNMNDDRRYHHHHHHHGGGVAKSFLDVIAEYQIENFILKDTNFTATTKTTDYSQKTTQILLPPPPPPPPPINTTTTTTQRIEQRRYKQKQMIVLKKHNHELNSLLGVWEVLLYLWTPAFTELAMKGDFTKNLTSGR